MLFVCEAELPDPKGIVTTVAGRQLANLKENLSVHVLLLGENI